MIGLGLAGAGLLGWAVFYLIEYQILGLYRVNETVPRADWPWWDAGFLA